jgi:hypothetical protein
MEGLGGQVQAVALKVEDQAVKEHLENLGSVQDFSVVLPSLLFEDLEEVLLSDGQTERTLGV